MYVAKEACVRGKRGLCMTRQLTNTSVPAWSTALGGMGDAAGRLNATHAPPIASEARASEMPQSARSMPPGAALTGRVAAAHSLAPPLAVLHHCATKPEGGRAGGGADVRRTCPARRATVACRRGRR